MRMSEEICNADVLNSILGKAFWIESQMENLHHWMGYFVAADRYKDLLFRLSQESEEHKGILVKLSENMDGIRLKDAALEQSKFQFDFKGMSDEEILRTILKNDELARDIYQRIHIKTDRELITRIWRIGDPGEFYKTIESLIKGEIEHVKAIQAVLQREESFATDVKRISGRIKQGYVYLVKEKKPVLGFKVFSDLVESGVRGLCVTRQHPDDLKKEHSLGDAQIYWLTMSNAENGISATNMERLNKIIAEFTAQHGNSIVLLDGLEFLIVHNDFSKVLKFVHYVRDTVIMNKSRMLIPVDVDTLEKRDAELLARELEPLEVS